MKTVLVVLAEGFEDVEAVAPIDILTRAGVKVTVAGLTPGPVAAAYGTTLVPHGTLDDYLDVDFDGILFAGGRRNAQALAADKRVIELVHRYYRAGKMVAAICASPSHVLGEAAGILKGRRATGDPAFNDKLKAAGAVITDQAATVDGNIVTGMGPGAAMLFGLQVCEYLVGRETADEFAKRWRINR